MEQKRTLWIVAAAGIFLLVVVGAALIIYSPSLHNTPVQQASFDPSTGWVKAPSAAAPATQVPEGIENETAQNSSALPYDPLASVPAESKNSYPVHPDFASAPNSTIQAQNVTVITQETTTFDLNALKASANSNVVAQNQYTAEQIKSAASEKYTQKAPVSAPVQENYYTPTSTPKASAPAKTAPKTAAKAAPAKTAPKVTAAAKAETATKVSAAAKKPADLFWVQVGAYSSKNNADSARSVLEANKIPVEVFTDNKYFKVRVGPYQTRSEAVYWQKMVSEISKFADSKSIIINSAVQK